MTSDIILGIPFLMQIYPFYVNDIGLHTKILGKIISFKFLTEAKQKEIAYLQTSSIFKQISTITKLQKDQSIFIQQNELQSSNHSLPEACRIANTFDLELRQSRLWHGQLQKLFFIQKKF